jgi:putative membrane protein
MKRIVRCFVIDTGALYIIWKITSGLVFEDGFQSLILTGAALMLVSFLIKPVINLLLLPLNLITFGLFRWVGHAITLYLVDLVLTDFSVHAFYFAGFQLGNFVFPSLSFESGFLSYIGFSFFLALITSVIYWLVG